MKKIFISLMAVILGMTVSVYGAESRKAQQKERQKIQQKQKQKKQAAEIKWHADIDKALAAAKKSKKPILLVHIAPQVNNNSKLFNEKIIKNKEFTKFASALEFVKFEYKDMKNISPAAKKALKNYPVDIQGNKAVMPTVYLLDSTGAIKSSKSGAAAINPENYLKDFKKFKNTKKPKKK